MSHNSRCAFFNPHHIKGESCTKNSEGVQSHIIDMFTFHVDKTFFVAPYLAINHWTLIIICPSTERGYIIDSINREKDQHSYLLTSIIDEAFGFPFLWEMVKCKQQKNDWECSFMIIKHMHEFVNSIQHDFPIKLWNEKGFLPQKEIDKLILDLVPQFISMVFPTGQMLSYFVFRISFEF
ncbi:putative Ulp1 protease family catalytic domain, papain-like cysteine peptidase superfamily [Helianthus anomalus]